MTIVQNCTGFEAGMGGGEITIYFSFCRREQSVSEGVWGMFGDRSCVHIRTPVYCPTGHFTCKNYVGNIGTIIISTFRK